ncbi:metallophosphoesterase [Frigidibacter sp. MR17.24]|uniref:metallophosphoesterase n=1 Tax=Frigidibacter sp. MR17.24 TaxID=3127345 RepID=UPI003012FAA8
MRTYAVGDIHGQLARLDQAHARIAADRALTGDAEAPVIHLGDLVDRGPDSAGVIARIRGGIAAGEPWAAVKGNHDRMFLGWLADPWSRDPGLDADLGWLHPRLGSDATLASYGIRAPGDRPVPQVHAEALAAVPQEDRDWLASRPAHIRRGELLLVHAGIRPGVPLDQQTETDRVWIRKPFLEDPRDHGFLVVHGHTALDRACHHGNRVNLDGGAGYGRALVCAVFEGRDCWLLTDAGREPLPAP